MLSVGEPIRPSRFGAWYTTDGGAALLLSVDGGAPAAAAIERLVTRVQELRAIALPGVADVVDLVADGDRIWVAVGGAVTPTLEDVMAGGAAGTGPLDLVRRTAETLQALHRTGIVHGGVAADNVVVRADGTVVLVEVGLADTLAGTPVAPADDVAAWSALVRRYATRISAGPEVVRTLLAAATSAVSSGWDAVLELLAPIPEPPAAPAAPPPPVAATPVATPEPPVDPKRTQVGRRSAAASVTSPASTTPASAGAPASTAPAPAVEAPAAPERTQLGRRRQAELSRPALTPYADPPVPVVPATGVAPYDGRRGGRGPVRRQRGAWRAIRAGLLTGLVGTVVLVVAWWFLSPPLAVEAVTVAPAVPVAKACDIVVDVVGSIHTTGRGGILSYEWTRSDGQSSGVLHETVPPGEHEVRVHLEWSFGGTGKVAATATLTLISPAAPPATGSFAYDCSG